MVAHSTLNEPVTAVSLLQDYTKYENEYADIHQQALDMISRRHALENKNDRLLQALADIDSCLAKGGAKSSDLHPADDTHSVPMSGAPIHTELLQIDFLQYGGAGADILSRTTDVDVISGEGGNDSLTGLEGNDILLGGLGNDTLDGGDGNDLISGDEGADTLTGGSGDDNLFGGAGQDSIVGDGGMDHISGGTDKDILTGGTDGDTFIFYSTAEVGKAAAHDVITDFSQAEGDRIDVSIIDADTTRANNQKFEFLDSSHSTFTDAGQILIRFAGGNTFVDFNTDSNTSTIEATLELKGISSYPQQTLSSDSANSGFGDP